MRSEQSTGFPDLRQGRQDAKSAKGKPINLFSHSWRLGVLGVLGAICIATLPGCQAAHVSNPVVAKFGDDDTQLDFWHDLADQRLTSNDDAFHGVILYLDNTDPSTNYTQRVAALKARKLLPSNFTEPADLAIERGTLAVMLVKVLHIKGGWVMHVFGDLPRYAVKELMDTGVYPPSSPQQTFSGSEFVGVIGKLEDYQASASAAGS